MTALSRPRRLSAPPVAALFQLFRYTFGVATRSAVAERRIRSLYAPFETRADVATAVPFRLEVRRTDESRRWEAYLGDQLLVSRPSLGAALYGLEVEICLRVIASRPDLIMLHGATVLAAGGAAFLSGPSGAGKSTLALALAARGYRIGGNDVALLEPCTGVIQPLPHCFHLDARSRRLLRREGLPMPAEAIRHNFLTATDLGMGAAIGSHDPAGPHAPGSRSPSRSDLVPSGGDGRAAAGRDWLGDTLGPRGTEKPQSAGRRCRLLLPSPRKTFGDRRRGDRAAGTTLTAQPVSERKPCRGQIEWRTSRRQLWTRGRTAPAVRAPSIGSVPNRSRPWRERTSIGTA